MDQPIAFKFLGRVVGEVHRINIDPQLGSRLEEQGQARGPAVIVARHAALLPNLSAGVVDAGDIIAVTGGDWGNAIMIVLPTPAPDGSVPADAIGDARFLAKVERSAPDLFELACETVAAIRKAGVEGRLEEATGGRWVNRPVNTFTLKPQPRARNLQFTLYGNPGSFDAGEFLLQDQNSYSRGWVRAPKDAKLLAELARQSHLRRKRR